MQNLLTYAALGGIGYILFSRLNNNRMVAREPELFKNPEKGMSTKGVYDSFKKPSDGTTGLQNTTIQHDGDLNEIISKMSWDAAEGDPKAQRWLVEHNMRRGLHVGGNAITGHLGIGSFGTGHLVGS